MMNLQKDQHKIKKIPLQWAEAVKKYDYLCLKSAQETAPFYQNNRLMMLLFRIILLPLQHNSYRYITYGKEETS